MSAMPATTPEPQQSSGRTRERKLSVHDRQDIVTLSLMGWSGPRLARRFNVHRSRITKVLKERGVARSRYPASPVSEDERRDILELSRQAASVDAMVRELRRRGTPRSKSTVYAVIKEGAGTATQESQQ
jgi:hypothetical protein